MMEILNTLTYLDTPAEAGTRWADERSADERSAFILVNTLTFELSRPPRYVCRGRHFLLRRTSGQLPICQSRSSADEGGVSRPELLIF